MNLVLTRNAQITMSVFVSEDLLNATHCVQITIHTVILNVQRMILVIR